MLKYFDRLKKFDYMIRHSITGTPKECAEKLEISRSRFYEFLEDLKLLDIPVEYNKDLKTYKYKKPGVLKLGFEERNQILEREGLNEIKGGAVRRQRTITLFRQKRKKPYTHLSKVS